MLLLIGSWHSLVRNFNAFYAQATPFFQAFGLIDGYNITFEKSKNDRYLTCSSFHQEPIRWSLYLPYKLMESSFPE